MIVSGDGLRGAYETLPMRGLSYTGSSNQLHRQPGTAASSAGYHSPASPFAFEFTTSSSPKNASYFPGSYAKRNSGSSVGAGRSYSSSSSFDPAMALSLSHRLSSKMQAASGLLSSPETGSFSPQTFSNTIQDKESIGDFLELLKATKLRPTTATDTSFDRQTIESSLKRMAGSVNRSTSSLGSMSMSGPSINRVTAVSRPMVGSSSGRGSLPSARRPSNASEQNQGTHSSSRDFSAAKYAENLDGDSREVDAGEVFGRLELGDSN